MGRRGHCGQPDAAGRRPDVALRRRCCGLPLNLFRNLLRNSQDTERFAGGTVQNSSSARV
jgi:hypothetical protein